MITNNKKLLAATAGAGGDERVVVTLNDPVSIGKPFTGNNGNNVTYAEFQDSGDTLFQQNLWGEWKYDLSTAYDLSTLSYQTNSARYWTIGQYQDGATYSQAGNSGNVFRVDYDNDKAYRYGSDGTTKILQDLDDYTKTSLSTLSSSSNPFSTSPSSYSHGGSTYVKKSGGGIAFMQANYSNDLIFLRNYANADTTTVSSYSTLDISSLDIGVIFLGFLSADGLTLSIYCRRSSVSSQYDVHKWTLSTAFDLSTAGSVSTTGPSSYNSAYVLERGIILNDNAISGKVIGWNMYGQLNAYTYTTDGDISTLTRTSTVSRSNNGGYLNGSSYTAWFDDGKKVIDMGYSTTHYVYDTTSDPYGWQFHDIEFGNRSNGYTQIYTSNSNEGQTFSDGRLNAAKDKLYSSYYSSTYRVTERNITTAGDITTLSGGYSGHNSQATFTGWTGGYSSNSSWYDKDNNKFHLADFGNSSGTYFIFDLDSNGEYTLAGGTYDTTPTGFTAGDFYQMYQLQPLSADGTYFTYYNSGICYVIELDVPFNPAQGYTEIGSFNIEYNLPNGTTRAYNKSQLRMYVSSGRIHFTSYYTSNITAIIDVTIDGQAPDDIT